MPITLFRIITERDEIIVGYSERELAEFGVGDAPGLASALVARSSLPAWSYAVGRKDGALAYVSQARIGLFAHGSLRIEPYSSAYAVIPPGA